MNLGLNRAPIREGFSNGHIQRGFLSFLSTIKNLSSFLNKTRLALRFLSYKKDLKAFSRKLRNHSTLGEVLLWQKLRAGSIKGYQFNRQKPLGNYIVDFYCKKLNLVIEVDGTAHDDPEQKLKDKKRQEILQGMGLSFLRFHDEEVKKDMDVVVKKIEDYIEVYEARQGSKEGGRL